MGSASQKQPFGFTIHENPVSKTWYLHIGKKQTAHTQEISYVDLPVKYMDTNGRPTVVVEPWPILDIHNTMSFLFKEAKIKIPGPKLREYWQRSKAYGEPWAADVPDEEMSFTVPIGIYGDSARVHTNFNTDHIMALFVNLILWRPVSVRWSRFLVCAIPESRLTNETINGILRRVTWSANHAFYARFPTTDPLGQPLRGNAARMAGKPLTDQGYKFQVTELRGDWSFHKKIWTWPKVMWNAESICHLCTAKGISNDWDELFWNLEHNNHQDFSLTQYLAHRMPTRRVWFWDHVNWFQACFSLKNWCRWLFRKCCPLSTCHFFEYVPIWLILTCWYVYGMAWGVKIKGTNQQKHKSD